MFKNANEIKRKNRKAFQYIQELEAMKMPQKRTLKVDPKVQISMYDILVENAGDKPIYLSYYGTEEEK